MSTRYRLAILADGPVGYWRLGDRGQTAVDQVAGRNGTISGDVSSILGAIKEDSDGALKGGGVSALVDVTSAAALNFGTGSFSVEWWAWFPADGTNPKWSFGKGTPYNNGPTDAGWALAHWTTADPISVQMYLSDGGVTGVVAGGGGFILPAAPAVYRGTWHHSVYVFDRSVQPGTARLYQDGAVFATATFPVGFGSVSTAADLTLLNGNGNPTTGALDEFALYAYPLSAAQVAAHYTLGVGPDGPPFNVRSRDGVKGARTSVLASNLG